MPATVKTVIDEKAFLDSVEKGVRMANRRIKSSASKLKLSFDEKGFRQPLGKITGDLKMFDSALAASNARVIAFGASTAVIGGISRAFKELAKTTIEVEKQFADINRILQISNKNFENFGNQLFEIGKKNAASFQDTSKAALEFARQGLKVEDTLKRTSDALTLVRLTGINADKAVSTLTATVNAFEGSMLDTTTAVNKFVAVETKFAVGARDLVEAIGRVGSSAIDAKVGFDELNAMVTSVQQTTGRGGAVIGNAMKTIFTRLQRQSTLEALEQYNVAVRDVQGNTLPAMQILDNFAKSYAGLTDASQSYLREQVAGVFQANILSAILKDLNKDQSTFSKALNVSKNATDEANQATAELNRTLSALASQTGLEFQRLQQNIGKATFEPIAKELLLPLKNLMKGISDTIDGEGAGSEIANGLLKGLRNILGGPGLVAAIGLIGKVFLNTTSYIVKSLPALAGITTETQKRANLEQTIQSIMERESALASAIDGYTGDTARQSKLIADYAELAAQDMERQDKAVKGMAATLRTMPTALTALSKTTGGAQLGQPKTRRGASGFIPGIAGEVHDIKRGVGGVSPSSKPVTIPNFAFGGGVRGTMIANTGEYIVPNYSNGGSAIFNPNMIAQYGMPAGAKPIRGAGGYVPNFADVNKLQLNDFARMSNADIKKDPKLTSRYLQVLEGAGLTRTASTVFNQIPSVQVGKANERMTANRAKEGRMFDATSFADMLVPTKGFKDRRVYKFTSADNIRKYGAEGAIYNRRGIDNNAENQLSNLVNVEAVLEKSIVEAANVVLKSIHPQFVEKIPVTEKELEPFMKKEGAPGAIGALKGAFFEALIGRMVADKNATPDGITLDTVMSPAVKKLFVGGMESKAKFADFKNAPSGGNDKKFVEQVLKNRGRAAGGYVPNFAALGDAVEREVAAGVPISSIRVNRSSKFVSPNNPAGLAVTNKRDEPNGLADVMRSARGYVPNFFLGGGQGEGIGNLNLKNLNTMVGMTVKKVGSLGTTFDAANAMAKDIAMDLRAGAMSGDVAKKEIAALASTLGMTKTQARVLQKKIMTASQGNLMSRANKALSGTGGMGAMMGLSMGLPMLSGFAEQAGASREVTGALNAAGTGASIGMIAGPLGAVIGTAIGGLGGLAVQASKVGVSLEELDKDLSEFDKTTAETTNAGEAYIKAQKDISTAGSRKELEQAQKNAADALERIKGTELEKSFSEAGGNVKELTDSLTTFVEAQETERKGRRLVSAGKQFELEDTTLKTKVRGTRAGTFQYTVAEKVFGEATTEAFIEQFGSLFVNLTEDQIKKLEAGAKKGLPTLGFGGGLKELRPVFRDLLGVTEEEMSDDKLDSIFSPAMIEGLKKISDISEQINKTVKEQKEEEEANLRAREALVDSLVAIRRDVLNAAEMVQSSPLMKFKEAFNKLNSAFASVSSDILTLTGDLVGAAQISATSSNRGRAISQLQTRRGFGSAAATDFFKAFEGAVNQNQESLDMLRKVSDELITDPKKGLKMLQSAIGEEGAFGKNIVDPTKFIALENLEKRLQARFDTQEQNIKAENLIAGIQNKINIRKAEINEQQRQLNAAEKVNNLERTKNLKLAQIAAKARMDAINLEKSDPRLDIGLTKGEALKRQQTLDRKLLTERQEMSTREMNAQKAAIEAEFAISDALMESNYSLKGSNEELKKAVEDLAREMIGSAAPEPTQAEYDAAFRKDYPRLWVYENVSEEAREARKKSDKELREKTRKKFVDERMDPKDEGSLPESTGDYTKSQPYIDAKRFRDERLKNLDDINKAEIRQQDESFNNSTKQASDLAKEQTEFSKGLVRGFDEIYKDIDQIYNRLGKQLPATFKDGMINALEASLDKAETFGDAMRGVAIDMLKTIRRASLDYSMSNFTSLIGMGVSKGFRNSPLTAQNGAFVPGTGTGDRVPALLEPGEYVMNRKAVAGIGKANLDKINFGMLPRFANGGSMGLNESVKSSRMSGFFLASDNPELEEAREAERARLAEEAAKKAQKKQLLSTFLSTVASVGISKLINMASNETEESSGVPPYLLRPGTEGPLRQDGTFQRGGHISAGFTNRDSVPAYMAGGEFVMNNRAVRKYGLGFMGRLNGGLIPKMQAGGMAGAESAPLNAQTAANTNNISINVNVGGAAGQAASNSTGNSNASEQSSTDQATQGKELGEKIRSAVLEVIQEEQRLGGSLSQSNRR